MKKSVLILFNYYLFDIFHLNKNKYKQITSISLVNLKTFAKTNQFSLTAGIVIKYCTTKKNKKVSFITTTTAPPTAPLNI